MTSTNERLRHCFEAAFPDLAPDEITSASVETVRDWDSLHAVILVALLEEAFAIRIPSRDYPRLRSHAAVSEYLTRVNAQ
jgi:acyl carrier protein